MPNRMSNEMSDGVKKTVSATILGFLGSSLLVGATAFFAKDTIERMNDAVDKVNQADVQREHLQGAIVMLNKDILSLNETVDKTAVILQNYTQLHGKNLSLMSISMARVTEKLINLEEDCDENKEDIAQCQQNQRGDK